MSSTACHSTHDRASSGRGFTLIEMMVVLAIVGILLAIAVPSYQAFIRNAQESAAKSLLLNVAQKQTQYRVDRRGAFCCTGVTADAAGATAMLAGLGISVPKEVSDYFNSTAFYQAYRAPEIGPPAVAYLPAAYAYCLEPKVGAARGTRAFRIDQSGRRTVGVDCTANAGGAAHDGALTW